MRPNVRCLFKIAILVALSSLAWPSAASDFCAIKLTAAGVQLLQLLERGLDRRLIDAQDVPNGEWTNPFRRYVAAPGNSASQRAFDRLSARLSEDQKKALRPAMQTLVQSRSAATVSVQQANIRVRPVWHPGAAVSLGTMGARPTPNPYTFGWWEGRPVFEGLVIDDRAEKREVLLDPFAPALRDAPIGLPAPVRPQFSGAPGHFFTREGETYFLRAQTGLAVNLQTRRPLSRRALFGTMLRKVANAEASLFAEVQGQLRLAISLPTGKDKPDRFMVMSLMEPGAKLGFLGNINTGSYPRLAWLDGHAVASFLGYGGMLRFADIGTGEIFPEVLAQRDFGRQSFAPALYSDQGKWLALVRLMTGRPETSGLAVLDIRSGDTVRFWPMPIALAGEFGVLQIGDVPYAYFVNGLMNLVNLRTGEFREILQGGVTTGIRELEFRGQRYLIWATTAGKLEIYDIAADNVIQTRSYGNRFEQLEVFIYHDRPYAFLAAQLTPPILVPLTDEN